MLPTVSLALLALLKETNSLIFIMIKYLLTLKLHSHKVATVAKVLLNLTTQIYVEKTNTSFTS